MGDRLGIPGAVGFLFFFSLFFIFAGGAVRNRPSLFALEVEFKRLTSANIRVLANYFFVCAISGTSANAGPHYQKLYARVTHIWGNRRGQPNRSAMRGPHPERTAFVITVASRVR